jgi:hypothetical protein
MRNQCYAICSYLSYLIPTKSSISIKHRPVIESQKYMSGYAKRWTGGDFSPQK